MADRKLITAERLREVLHYDPVTGIFTWRAALSNSVIIGQRAGTVCTGGYLQIQIDGRLHNAARLVFLYIKGELPINDVDHENLDRLDNRWINLREATKSQNALNRRRRSDNTSGYKGVLMDKKRRQVRASITINGKRKHLGMFNCPEDAHAAYREAVALYHGKFGRAE
jgi:hypothetical protein